MLKIAKAAMVNIASTDELNLKELKIKEIEYDNKKVNLTDRTLQAAKTHVKGMMRDIG